MNANDVVGLILKSPLRPLLGPTMLISVTGRRSGRLITTPVNYRRDGSTLWVLSSRDRRWWRNVAPGSRVQLFLDGHPVSAIGEVVQDEAEVAIQLAEYVRRVPAAARALHIRLDHGTPDSQEVAKAAVGRLFMKFCLA
ncbi:MAG TPA: nitroreductase/quinone reductase family protein [Anaerolineales bacterium]